MTSALRGGADNGRVDWIDTAKAISILLVTLYHVALLGAAAGLPVHKIVALNSFLAPIRMPLFFAAAGVFAGAVITKPWTVLLTRRVALYIWLFLTWTIVRWCFSAFVVRNPASPGEGSRISEIGWAMLMPTTGLWFLWSLALFFAAAKLLSALPPRVGIAVAVFASICVMIAVANREHRGVPELLGNIAHRNSILYFAFFFAAAVAPQLIRSLGRVRVWRSVAICGAIFAAMTLVIRRVEIDAVIGVARFIASVAGVAAMLLFARVLDRLVPVTRTMHYIGRNTLPIYVAQVPLIVLFTHWSLFVGSAESSPLANMLVLFEVPLVVATALVLRAVLSRCGAKWLYEMPTWRPASLRKSPAR